MCVIACKYLENLGWVGIKNRDRNYKPSVSIKQSFKGGVESLYLLDSVTKYSEGVNEYGICIINSATSVKNDESQVTLARRHEKRKQKQEGTYVAPDGILVRKALKAKTLKEAIQILIDGQLVGNTLVFNENECYLIEAGRDKDDFEANMKASEEDPEHEWTDMKFTYDVKKISKNNYIVRTNHGHFLPWLGYQKNSTDEKQIKSRESSETRHNTVIKNLKNANSIEDMIKAVSDLSNKNSQLNPIRLGDYQNRTKLKTTAQFILVPKKREMIYTPVWSYVDAKNFDRVNNTKTKTYFTLKPFNVNLVEHKMSFKDFYYINNEV